MGRMDRLRRTLFGTVFGALVCSLSVMAQDASSRATASPAYRVAWAEISTYPPDAPYFEAFRSATMSTPKEDLTRLIESQPYDASPEIVREPAFDVMIQCGLADSDARRTISN